MPTSEQPTAAARPRAARTSRSTRSPRATRAARAAKSAAGKDAGMETLWRVVFPSEGIGLDDTFRQDAMPVYGSGRKAGGRDLGIRHELDASTIHGWVKGRDELEVPAGFIYSTGCYYNGFPAAYWAKWTNVREVTLLMEVSGAATVTVRKSDPSCKETVLATREVQPAASAASVAEAAAVLDEVPEASPAAPAPSDASATTAAATPDAAPKAKPARRTRKTAATKPAAPVFTTVEVTVPIASMSRGGWLWFDVEAKGAPATFRNARWTVPTADKAQAPVRKLTASLAITTMNKPQWCIRQFNLLVNHADMSLIDAITVVDQGAEGKLVSEHEGYAAIKDKLGDKLRIVRQINIGGSGGFARGMHEIESRGESGYALLMDDDTVVEPESISRALAFANHCKKPTIVGGNMLFLTEPTRLCAVAEVFDRKGIFWAPAKNTPSFDDMGKRPFLNSRYLHTRADADYNAWWMCLIPVETIRKAGLSYPFFIKNDDVEYGVRAQTLFGTRTVTVPGVCLWHMSWVDKDDILDWQAYFHVRNKLIMGLLYSRLPFGGKLLVEEMRATLAASLKMRYSAVRLHRMAAEDVLAGPEHIGEILESRLPEIRAARAEEPDTQAKPLEEMPDTIIAKSSALAESVRNQGKVTTMLRRLVPPRRNADTVIDGYVEPRHAYWLVNDDYAGQALRRSPDVLRDGGKHLFDDLEQVATTLPEHWRAMGQMDSAVLVNLDKGEGTLLRRRPLKAIAGVGRVAALYARLALNWRKYQSAYRKEFAEMTSPEWWDRYFRAPEGK